MFLIASIGMLSDIDKINNHIRIQQAVIQKLSSELEYKDLVLTNKCKK